MTVSGDGFGDLVDRSERSHVEERYMSNSAWI